MINQLYVLLKLYPDAQWVYYKLSENPNLTWDIIFSDSIMKKAPWNVESLSNNTSIITRTTIINIITNYTSEFRLGWKNISRNPGITWDVIVNNEKFPGSGKEIPWDWDYISCNPNITWENVKSKIYKNWNWSKLSKHANITWDIIINNLYHSQIDSTHAYECIGGRNKIRWDWSVVSQNPNVTWDIVVNTRTIPGSSSRETMYWNYSKLSKHIDLNIIMTVNKHPISGNDVNWDWCNVLKRKDMTNKIARDILCGSVAHCQTSLTGGYTKTLLSCPAITWDIIEENIHKHWDWNELSRHPKITWQNILDNCEYTKSGERTHWNWKYVSCNPNVTWEIITAFPEFEWDMKYVSLNPNITYKIIRDNVKVHWDWDWLSMNKFNKDPSLIRRRLMRKYFNTWLTRVRYIREYKCVVRAIKDCCMMELKLHFGYIPGS